jgi:hypothetical protein
MTKNYIIPKENISKIEEVREIENQIPTYEEFLKNSNQEQVNYTDLTHEDLNSIKGYGPCAWRNSQYGEQWESLQMPCPASGCGNTSVINQTHTCGGQVEISNKARIRCRSCGDISLVRDFKFSCSNHGRVHTDLASFTDAVIATLDYRGMNESFAAELLQNLRSSYRN